MVLLANGLPNAMQQRLHSHKPSGRRRVGRARRRPHPDSTILVALAAPGWTIGFANCPDVVDGLEMILHGWKMSRLPAGTRRKPDASVTRTAKGYVWRSDVMPRPTAWDSKPPASTMHVVWDVHDVFFDWFLKQNPRHLCLHGAAVRIGNGLVCFPSLHKSGKSTLCIDLVRSGQRLFCDDVLPIEPKANRGMAMGIAPMLRKPLPASLGSRLIRFATERAGPSNKSWAYMKLGGTEIAPLGTVAPIKALVLLQREARRRAKIEPVPKNEMLREILLQNFAQVPPVETLDRLLQIAERAGCYRLCYSQVADAARLLVETFADSSKRSSAN
jgi:hypothetical protein